MIIFDELSDFYFIDYALIPKLAIDKMAKIYGIKRSMVLYESFTVWKKGTIIPTAYVRNKDLDKIIKLT